MIKQYEKQKKPLQHSSQMVGSLPPTPPLDYCPALLINSLASFQTRTQADIRFPVIELLVQEFVVFQSGSWLLQLIEEPPDCSHFSPAEKKFKEKTTHTRVLTLSLPDIPYIDDLSLSSIEIYKYS